MSGAAAAPWPDIASAFLDLDIVRLKEEVAQLIAVHPHVEEFDCITDFSELRPG